MKFYMEYRYDDRWNKSCDFEGDTLSEIYEQAKYVHRTLDNCPIFICFYDFESEITKLPL